MLFGIVIPCYNEALRLKLDDYCAYLESDAAQKVRMCFVNDGSTDTTGEILKLLQRQYTDQIHVIDLKVNTGKAEAVRSGMQYLLGLPNIHGVGFMDADLSTNFKEYQILIDRYHRHAGNGMLIFGSRPLGRAYNYQRKWTRTLASIVARASIRGVIGMDIMDTQCGAKVMTVETASHCFSQPFKTRWLFDVEVLLRMKAWIGTSFVQYKFSEVYLKEWVDVRGSKITFVDAVEMPAQLLSIYLQYRVFPGIRHLLSRLWSLLPGKVTP